MSILAFWSGYRIGKVDGQRDTFEKIEERLEEKFNSHPTISQTRFVAQAKCFYLIKLNGEKTYLLTLLESSNCEIEYDEHFLPWYLYTYKSTDKPWAPLFMESNEPHIMGPFDTREDAVSFRTQVISHEERKSNTVVMDSTSYFN